MRVIERLIDSIRDAAVFNSDVQVSPSCILWPDGDRQWEPAISLLQKEVPELFILADYDPSIRRGPAIWLRCVIARRAIGVEIPDGKTPIFYLPGVSRQDLRAVETCPDHLKPLAELQYRGVFWSQENGKDWTIFAFLKSDQGGLGLDVAHDNEARSAMQLGLSEFLEQDAELLKVKRLDKTYFNTLLTGGDSARDLLQWLDQADAFRDGRGKNRWRAFVEVCKSQFVFNPDKEGILTGATKFAAHEGPWLPVWVRFCEAPHRYPNIPGQIRKCRPPADNILWKVSDAKYEGWPQWNEEQEVALLQELSELTNYPPHESRIRVKDLEKRHSARRKSVWAELGESPLAFALEHLAVLSERTSTTLAAGNLEELATGYQSFGWQADDAVIRALACIDRPEDLHAVTLAIRAVYLPWLEESARYLQKIVTSSGYSRTNKLSNKPLKYDTAECILFVDGLRFDAARRLSTKLVASGCTVDEKPVWSALPSVTATGKPAVSPVTHRINGAEVNADFEPCVAETGQSLKGGYQLKKLLAENDWDILERSSHGNGHGNAWCEFGDIDSEGHERGWKLAKHIDNLLNEIKERVVQLLRAGNWKSVRIVTDHGWLLMPGGLPNIVLPKSLSENKWGRCAAIKAGAKSDERLYPWFWNPVQEFALADGVSCFKKGEEYTHGGLSLQECLNLELSVSLAAAAGISSSVEIADVVWKGLRCAVAVDGDHSGLLLDIRSEAGDKDTSLLSSTKPFKDNGTASVLVKPDFENTEGKQAFIVILDQNERLVAQRDTTIGGGNQTGEELT